MIEERLLISRDSPRWESVRTEPLGLLLARINHPEGSRRWHVHFAGTDLFPDNQPESHASRKAAIVALETLVANTVRVEESP